MHHEQKFLTVCPFALLSVLTLGDKDSPYSFLEQSYVHNEANYRIPRNFVGRKGMVDHLRPFKWPKIQYKLV